MCEIEAESPFSFLSTLFPFEFVFAAAAATATTTAGNVLMLQFNFVHAVSVPFLFPSLLPVTSCSSAQV